MKYFKRVRFDEVITNSFMLVKGNLRELIRLTLIPMSISFVSQYGLGLTLKGSPLKFIVCTILYILSHYFIYVLMVHVISLIILEKEWDSPSVYRSVLKLSLGEISGTVGLFIVIFLIGPLLIFTTGQLIFFIPSIIAGVFFAFFLPLTVLKKVYYKEPLMESYKLVSGQWFRVFIFYSLATVLFGLAFFGLTMLFSSVTKFILPSNLQPVVFTVIFFITTAFFSLLEHSFHTLFFFSIRGEKENYGVLELKREFFSGLEDSSQGC